MKTLYRNGRVILEDRILPVGSVLAEDGRIVEIRQDTGDAVRAARVVDAQGRYISPGFVDTHAHGGAGYDVMDATREALEAIALTHYQHGCTAFLPTTLTSARERIQAAVRTVHEVMHSAYEGARVLGVHLEGPCFSMAFKGAQNPAYLANPSIKLFEALGQGLGIVRRVSMAPELEGAFETAAQLHSQGINVSVAHSDATFQCVEEAASHGFSHITHMYNGMSVVRSMDYYCRPGVAEAGLLLDSLTAEVIADGKHMPPEILRLLYKCKGPEGLLLTTDSTRPTNMPEGNYELGGLDVLVTDGVAMLADRTSFAGSVATCDRLVRFAYKECGFPLHEAVRMASLNHAKLIGLDGEIGSLAVGKVADVIMFDENIEVSLVERAAGSYGNG